MTTIEVDERNNGSYSGTVYDESSQVVDLTSVDEIKATLYDIDTGTIINSRSGQNAKNANQFTATAQGVFTFAWRPEDQIVIDDSKDVEDHMLLVVIKWGSGARQVNKQIVFRVSNVRNLV